MYLKYKGVTMRYTKNYNLNLYELDDNANLADGYNNSMERVDSLLYQFNSMLTSANIIIESLQTKCESLEERVTALEGKL